MTTKEKIIKFMDEKYPNVERWKYEGYCEKFAEFADQIREETIEEIIKYQNGFVKQGSQPEEYDIAPEWQVIEDLLNQLKNKEE